MASSAAAATKTIHLTLDTTAPGWTNSLGIAYVGWVTDYPGGNGANISNFSLTATKTGSYYDVKGTVEAPASRFPGPGSTTPPLPAGLTARSRLAVTAPISYRSAHARLTT